MDRKEFIKSTCGVCMALGSVSVLSAIIASCKTPLGVIKTTSQENVVTIPLAEFADSTFKMVRVRNYDYDLAMQRLPDGTFETLVLQCTHAGYPLTKTGNTYYCTLHGSQFSHEGHVLKGPAAQDLRKLRTAVGKDMITIYLS